MADEETRENEQEEVDIQKRYILAKIDKLVEGLGPGYGEALLEELIERMERTVAHFHEEVTELLETLKSSSRKREEKLRQLMEVEEVGEAGEEERLPEPAGATTAAEEEMSEWEKRLEARAARQARLASAESGPTKKEVKEEQAQKRKLFGRKK